MNDFSLSFEQTKISHFNFSFSKKKKTLYAFKFFHATTVILYNKLRKSKKYMNISSLENLALPAIHMQKVATIFFTDMFKRKVN